MFFHRSTALCKQQKVGTSMTYNIYIPPGRDGGHFTRVDSKQQNKHTYTRIEHQAPQRRLPPYEHHRKICADLSFTSNAVAAVRQSHSRTRTMCAQVLLLISASTCDRCSNGQHARKTSRNVARSSRNHSCVCARCARTQ